MNYRKLLIATIFLVFISGCSDFMMICSLNPFYLEKNITLAPEIEGRWLARPIRIKKDSEGKESPGWELADTISTWQIRRFIAREKQKTKRGTDSTVYRPQNFYVVKLAGNSPDSVCYEFHLTVFRINGDLYGDFCPRDITDVSNSRMAKENYFTVHTLAKISIQNKQFSVSWLGAEYMKDMIEKKRVRIKYRWVPDAKRLLLTASSQELTEMLERYANQKRFIDWDSQPAQIKFSPINQMP